MKSEKNQRQTEARSMTLRGYAQERGLADWQLAALCAATKYGPDETIPQDVIERGVEVLETMRQGG